MIELKQAHTKEKFDKLVKTAKQFGFSYLSTSQLNDIPLKELIERILTVHQGINDKDFVQAILGGEEQQELKLSQALELFWDYSKPTLLNKNTDQQRKWKNPRIKAINNFIKIVEDKNISDITHHDLILLRDWWLGRMKTDDIKADTVNKDFTHLKGVLETVSTHEGIEMDVEKLFKKIPIKEDDRRTREAYPTSFIKDEIFNAKNLKDLDEEARNILFVCANIGARPIEIVNLEKEDICLDGDVPYVHIQPRKGYSLKTKESERRLPLVGNVLSVFEKYNRGFKEYYSNSDKLSLNINKWLSSNNLRPTQGHSLYSFRHSFQDRLNALELPDRFQCQLMGHKFKRPKYGGGGSLSHLQEVMNKIYIDTPLEWLNR